MKRMVFLLVLFSGLIFAGTAVAGGDGNLADYFCPGKTLKGNQMLSAPSGTDLGTRDVTLLVSKDTERAKITMAAVSVSTHGSRGKDVPGRDFSSDTHFFKGEDGTPKLRVVDPKDNAKFTFRYTSGRVELEGIVTKSGAKNWDCTLN